MFLVQYSAGTHILTIVMILFRPLFETMKCLKLRHKFFLLYYIQFTTSCHRNISRSTSVFALTAASNINLVIETRKMRWVGNVACIGQNRKHNVFDGNLEEKDSFKDVEVDGKII